MNFDPANFFPVLPDQIQNARPHLEPWLARFDEVTRLVTPEDVFAQAARGDSQLWTYYDGEFRGVLATRIFRTSVGKICNLWVCIGDDVEWLIAGVYSTLEMWARDNGCYAMEIIGRPGWQKVLPGFKRKAVVLEKIISEVH